MGRSIRPVTSTTEQTVVFVLYDKVTLQDVAAPSEIFAQANDFGARYRVLLVPPTDNRSGPPRSPC